MAATYLIDGYNLLYSMGILQGRVGPNGLEKARQRLLGLLAGAFGADASSVTVVFDAAGAPPGAPEALEYRGVQVRFAVRHDEADDLIELLIEQSSAPRQLTVVSDDNRLQQAARRRACQVQGCELFLDWLDGQRRPTPRPPVSPEKVEHLSESERKHWLTEFADLADDPDFKSLFEPFPFE
ncbi:MAG: NYN domain-containing protein [Gemmataceae bacterium]|nr:NYN domain-containing protein [Gemmataceae bacterium]